MKISKQRLTELIKQELKEIIDLPSDLSTPAGPEELRMDELSKSWEKLITDRILDGETGIWSTTDVVDPIDGERRVLDEFLAILGNYVVSDEIDEGTARDLVKAIANQISDNLFEPSPHEWGIPLPKWENMPGFEPQDELQEGGRAGHLEPEDAILKALQNVVEAWAPETPEGQKYEADIFYTGNLEKDAVVQSISRNLSFNKDLTDSNSPVHQEYKTYIENTVYLIHDKKAVQSQIYLLTEGAVLDMDQRITSNAFSKYFGRGMASIVFQEIREFRSLAYSSSGYYVNRFHRDKRGYFRGYMGTQADKSIEAIHIYLDLLNDMPKKENRIDIIRSGLVQSINSSRPGFRAQGQAVSNWIKQGYPEDPNKFSYEKYKTLAFEDILSFYNSNIKKEPIVITVVTDKTKIDLEKLAEFGKVIEMTKKDIFN